MSHFPHTPSLKSMYKMLCFFKKKTCLPQDMACVRCSDPSFPLVLISHLLVFSLRNRSVLCISNRKLTKMGSWFNKQCGFGFSGEPSSSCRGPKEFFISHFPLSFAYGLNWLVMYPFSLQSRDPEVLTKVSCPHTNSLAMGAERDAIQSVFVGLYKI